MNKGKKVFGDFPEEYTRYANSKAVLLPVPYDGTSTWIKGADKGPSAIIDASFTLENYDIETKTEAYYGGIFLDEPIGKKEMRSPEGMAKAVEERVRKHLDNSKFVGLLGGEHSVSIGSIIAHSKKNPKDFGVLQLDAHADLRKEYHGSKYNHACVMARAREVCPVVQVGIRSMDIEELGNLDSGKMFFAENICNRKREDWISEVVEKLPSKVYLTIDLDAFDYSIMPSTGTPEPGGLSWYDVLALVRKVFEEKEVVGFDVVELCPNKSNKAPDYLAAKLGYKILTYKNYYDEIRKNKK